MEQTKTRPAPHPGKSQSSPAGKRPPEKKPRLTEREKQGAQTLLAILFVAGVLYLLIILIIAVCVWYSFSTPSESTALYSLRIVTEDGNIKRAAYSSSSPAMPKPHSGAMSEYRKYSP